MKLRRQLLGPAAQPILAVHFRSLTAPTAVEGAPASRIQINPYFFRFSSSVFRLIPRISAARPIL
jgi:hypothetical protein